MTQQLWWLVGIVAVILAGAIGFLLGRRGKGDRLRVAELEQELERKNDEISGYRREVESHFDRTAALFTSMAGNYRELFDHLSTGYAKLSGGSARELFRQRVDAVLLEGTLALRDEQAAEAGGEAATGDAGTERVDPVAAGMAGAADRGLPAAAQGPEGGEGANEAADEAMESSQAGDASPRQPEAHAAEK